jgi:hypothetical protein
LFQPCFGADWREPKRADHTFVLTHYVCGQRITLPHWQMDNVDRFWRRKKLGIVRDSSPFELRPRPPNGFLIREPIGEWNREPRSKRPEYQRGPPPPFYRRPVNYNVPRVDKQGVPVYVPYYKPHNPYLPNPSVVPLNPSLPFQYR